MSQLASHSAEQVALQEASHSAELGSAEQRAEQSPEQLPSQEAWQSNAAGSTAHSASQPPWQLAVHSTSASTLASRPRPLPVVEEVRRWWSERRAALDLQHRYLYGERRSALGVADALRRGPLSRAHDLAFEIAVRSRGAYVIPTRGLSQRRRAILDELERLDGFVRLDCERGYPG